MIQERTLELLKNPQALTAEDLPTLESELLAYPFMQSLRAVLLYGVHKYNPTAYKDLLSLTAAYTTDKKILYKLINPPVEVPLPLIDDKIEEAVPPLPLIDEVKKEVEPPIIEEKINDELLVAVEEEINDKTPVAVNDEEIKAVEPPLPLIDDEMEEAKPPIVEKVKKEVVPLKMEVGETEVYIPKAEPKNKYEEERLSLIAEVEAKMARKKNAAPVVRQEEDEVSNTDINFSEAERALQEETPVSEPLKTEEKPKEALPEGEVQEEYSVPSLSAWKPLSFSQNTPDALISEKKSEEAIAPPIETKKVSDVPEVEISSSEEKAPSPSDEHKSPVISISFISENEEIFQEEEHSSEIEAVPSSEEDKPQSNVPEFINTWQSWLKLDKIAAVEEEKSPTAQDIEEIKSKAIDTFIENNPKISKLKEENDFILKEKSDDISHLMTETLANLYLDQRLYAKAINAFELLSEKHPEKKDYFQQRIKEVKEIRQGKA